MNGTPIMRTEFRPDEKAVLAPPHPGDFGIPREHWGKAQNYADVQAVRAEAATPRQQAEPVGEVTDTVDGAFKCEFSQHLPVGTKLYTAPPQQQAEPVAHKRMNDEAG